MVDKLWASPIHKLVIIILPIKFISIFGSWNMMSQLKWWLIKLWPYKSIHENKIIKIEKLGFVKFTFLIWSLGG